MAKQKKLKKTAPEVFVDELKAQALVVAAHRIVQAVKKSIRLNLQRELEQRPEWVVNEHALVGVNADLADAETRLRETALDGFAELALKGPYFGVGVKEKLVLEFDRALALEWCRVNLPAAIAETVDEPTFLAAVKALPEPKRPTFVEFKMVPYATIAQDLRSVLPDEELVALLPRPEDLAVDVRPESKYPENWETVRQQVLQRDGYRCLRCGLGPENGRTLTVDHIWPVALGGGHELWNLRTLCQEQCHPALQIRVLEELPDAAEPN
ncbi:MAG: HNH endonuclease [Acidimicrobiales bacterium]